MGVHSFQLGKQSRRCAHAAHGFGPAIARYLEDPAMIEAMLNPDGRLWIDRLSGGLTETGERLSPFDGERRFPRSLITSAPRFTPASRGCQPNCPDGERFEGLLPPVVAAPAFAIRKPAVAVFTLDYYVAAGIMTCGQVRALKGAVDARDNILVAGGTSSGKTTLTNALLAEVAKTSDRVVLIEDTRELQCQAPNLVALRTKDGVISLSDLVRLSLRLRPDRIPIGEVRGAEALDPLKAWAPAIRAVSAPSMPAPPSVRCGASTIGSVVTVPARSDRRDHQRHRSPFRPRRAIAALAELAQRHWARAFPAIIA